MIGVSVLCINGDVINAFSFRRNSHVMKKIKDVTCRSTKRAERLLAAFIFTGSLLRVRSWDKDKTKTKKSS